MLNVPSLSLFAFLVFAGMTQAQTNVTPSPAPVPAETKEQRDARMAWWREAKFGLFIHWGVYSVPAGYYHGQPVKSIGEWIMCNGKIPCAEYQKFAAQFDPVKFNADAWVAMAKNAGMKYIVITSKHHDGFAMFPSKASKWNIYDATPWHHDPLRDLAEACRKQGIKLGFYYSQAQDWNNGGAALHGKWDPAQTHDMDDYIDKIAVPQVREILTNYGPDVPAVLWWDTPADMNHDRAQKLYDEVEQLKPGIIMNNRLGGGFAGDTETPEQHIPPKGYPGRDWETCMTINDTWGYKKDDTHFKTTEVLLRNLCDIASKGGNYLLNVGPDAQGLIPDGEVQRLAEVGGWMKTNGEAIYGTGPTIFGAEAGSFSPTEKDKKGGPLFVPDWTWRCTTKSGKIYLEVFKWPSGSFVLPPIKNKVEKAYLLAAPDKSLAVQQTATGVSISLPEKAPDAIASVICLEVDGQPEAAATAANQ